MFGYFRFNHRYASVDMKEVYRKYYCGTCFALESLYGQKARFLLSFDVVLLGLIAEIGKETETEKLPCFGKGSKKEEYRTKEAWKRLATINVLLFYAEIDDDIHDENSWKARAGYVIFKKMIKKAGKNYPQLAQMIHDGYREIYLAEQRNADIREICHRFGDFMVKLMKHFFQVDERKAEYIRIVAGWLYFIDQLDDYDEDVSKKKFNPLVIKGYDKEQFLNKKHDCLFEVMKDIMGNAESVKKTLDRKIPEEAILYSVLNETIPVVTLFVISNKKLPESVQHKNRSFWGEGY